MIVYAPNYNTQVFDLKEKDGLARGMAFLQALLEDAKTNNKSYNDIHTYVEETSLIVSWSQVYYDMRGDCGTFQYVDTDECVMKEVRFPDKHYEYVSSPQEEEERWNEWLEENPGWVQTSYGTWTNEIENQKWQESLKKEAATTDSEDKK